MAGTDTIALVTGASRGAGRGIAIALGSHGCTVYVTGRSETGGDNPLPGTIHETAAAVTAAGGRGIAVRCDHGDDAQVATLFERIEQEQGRLDILVNNACAIQDALSAPGSFWQKPVSLADMISIGVRSSYVATWHAAPMMVQQARGLVIFTSASGAVHYSMGPAYGAHKAGVDKLAADMALDFAETGVTTLSIWMGALATDRLKAMVAADPVKFAFLDGRIETPEYTGHVIWALHADPDVNAMTGQTLIGAEMGARYGVLDEGGRQPPSARDTHGVEPRVNYPVIVR